MAATTRVLVVDDEPHLRTFVRLLLCSTFEDLEVFEAGDESAALAVYAGQKPDLVLLDINLIGCSGLDVLQQILRADAEAEVVMLTAVSARHVVEDALTKGAAGYILKDTDEDELTEALLEIVRARFGDPNAAAPVP